MKYQDHFPVGSLEELNEMVATCNLFFFPLRTSSDVLRSTALTASQYKMKIQIYLIAVRNLN